MVAGSPVLGSLTGASPVMNQVGVPGLACHFPQVIAQLNRRFDLFGLLSGSRFELKDQLLEVVAA